MRLAALAAAAALLGAGVDGAASVMLIDADVALTIPFPTGKDVDDDLAVIYGQLSGGPRIVSLTGA
jgi:hypothetical protein